MTTRALLHLGLHILAPAAIAWLFFRKQTLRASLVMIATMLIDVDHFFANPIYDPNRCSIGFHPLHTWPAIVVYVLLLLPKKTRLVGIGLAVHMVLDTADCILMAR